MYNYVEINEYLYNKYIKIIIKGPYIGSTNKIDSSI